MYRRARLEYRKCNRRDGARESIEVGPDDLLLGGPAGRRQAAQAGSAVSYDVLSGINAHRSAAICTVGLAWTTVSVTGTWRRHKHRCTNMTVSVCRYTLSRQVFGRNGRPRTCPGGLQRWRSLGRPWGTIFAAQPLLAPLYRNDDSSRVGGKWSDETLGRGPVNIYN